MNNRLKISTLFAVALMALVAPVQAVGLISFQLTFEPQNQLIKLDWLFTNPIADAPDGNDLTWMSLEDCQGNILGFHVDSYHVEEGEAHASGVSFPLTSLGPILGRQITARLYNVSGLPIYYSLPELYEILQTYPILATATLEMGETYPECPAPQPDQGEPPVFADDRLNNDPGAPIVVYTQDNTFSVYRVWPGSSGTIAISVSLDTFATLETPDENTEITRSEDGWATIYKLSTGEIQINAGPDTEGKVNVYIFSPDGLQLLRQYRFIA